MMSSLVSELSLIFLTIARLWAKDSISLVPFVNLDFKI